MFKFTDWTLALALFFSTSSFAQSDVRILAQEAFESGLLANEKIIEFIYSRQCEFGMIKNCDRPLSARDHARLKKMFIDLDSWKELTFNQILPKTDILEGKKIKVIEGDHSITSTNSLLIISLDKLDPRSRQLVDYVSISAALKLIMYDNFFRLSEVLAKAKKIRTILQFDLANEGRILSETFAPALDEKVWRKTKLGLDFLDEAYRVIPPVRNIFGQYISSSFTGHRIRENDLGFRLRNILFFNRILSQTEFFEAVERFMGKMSQFFGNQVGKIQFRDGKLKKFTTDLRFMGNIRKKLKPLHIFFEKTPFRLTDKFIPGYFGHVAIWLGEPAELMSMTIPYEGRDLPLLEHPKVLPFLERMSQGKLVIEALREPGVTMSSLEQFLDVDDFMVVDPIGAANPAEIIIKALEQVGKPYDFNFDVETDRAIVCSELIYRVFDDREWPVSQSFGRFTISPDHVAWKAADNCMKPVLLFHDGEEIKTNLTTALTGLLQQRGGIRYSPTGGCLR